MDLGSGEGIYPNFEWGIIHSQIDVRLSNYWSSKFPEGTTVVYVFGVGRDMKRLNRWMKNESARLNKRIHLISLGFEIDGKKPVKVLGPNYLYTL